MRLWVEILILQETAVTSPRQPLREAVSWNTMSPTVAIRFCPVSLFVRLWVEISFRDTMPKQEHRQPLREAVSWNTCIFTDFSFALSQPLREAVSWNDTDPTLVIGNLSQPLREAVSWNILQPCDRDHGHESASSWGCELKYEVLNHISPKDCQPLREAVSWNIPVAPKANGGIGQPLREAVSWNKDW